MATVQRQFDLGADGVILHGASPGDLEPIVEAWAAHRAADAQASARGEAALLGRAAGGAVGEAGVALRVAVRIGHPDHPRAGGEQRRRRRGSPRR